VYNLQAQGNPISRSAAYGAARGRSAPLSRKRPWRWTILFGLALALAAGCHRSVEEPPSRVPVPKVTFRDITAKAGIQFQHTNGAFGKKLLPETMGSGVAFLDYDNDGFQDILFINSCSWPGYEDKSQPSPSLKLYRNNGDGTFKDVTKEAGLDVTLYGIGITAGDFDNDGYIDLFITALGGCRLFRNVEGPNKTRKFVDVTEAAGGFAPSGGWATTGDFLERGEPMDFPSSAAFLDYNKDGLLDIFVCRYVTWAPKEDLGKKFMLKGGEGERVYGLPQAFKGTFCQLFRNLGGSKFEDVSKDVGIQVMTNKEPHDPEGKSLGVLVWDADGDGWPDIFVANDTVRNFFFHNQPDPKHPGERIFKERGQEVGFTYADGQPRGGMGIDCGEYRPGKFAIVIGNFANEADALFRLEHPTQLIFSDIAHAEGIGGPSQRSLTFGLFFFDYDLDGRLDLLDCNGHLEPNIQKVQLGQTYAQPPQLFWNYGGKWAFEEVTANDAGPDLFVPLVGRGCAFADIDGDGYLDVVLTANGGPARLLHNEGGTGHHWLRLTLKGDGKKVNTSAIGAVVTLHAGGMVQQRQVASGRGYLSQSELPITFGLGQTATIDKVEIRWPGKDLPPQIVTGLAVDRMHVIEMKVAK
jgi:hypothetical protein